jgi:AAA domain
MSAVLPLSRTPRLVELVGPAGVGKSTLLLALSQRGRITPGTIWGQPVLPLLGHGFQLLPTLFGLWRHSGSLLWDESRHVVRLGSLHRAVRDGGLPQGRVVIFDEGPIFALAWLRGFGHATLRSQASEAWWRTAFRDWREVIDTVVVLEASDELLAGRIRSRPETHEVKELPDREIALWMARFREALDWVLAGMVQHGGPTVLRLSTDSLPAEHLAGRILESLKRGAHDN